MTDPVWYTFARSKLGVKETPGGASNPQILSWARQVGVSGYYKNDSIPWCGLFMGHCMKSNGFDVHSTLLSARSWARFGKALDRPTLGAIMVFTRTGGGHVCFYVSETATHYHVLGGNQRDQVCVTSYPKGRLLAIRWPDGTAAPSSSNIVRDVDDPDQGDDFGTVLSRGGGQIAGTVVSVDPTPPAATGGGDQGGGGSGKAVARLGDMCTHGAKIVTASANTYADGKLVARIGDLVDCPAHGRNKIVSPTTTTIVEGKPTACEGAMTECGAKILPTGSTRYDT